jgi:hypothetical protein
MASWGMPSRSCVIVLDWPQHLCLLYAEFSEPHLIGRSISACCMQHFQSPTRHFILQTWRLAKGGQGTQMCCRPEYAALKPLPDEAHPDTLHLTGRMGNNKYRMYQKRMQSLGFYSSVHMLESAGARMLYLSHYLLADFLADPRSETAS